MTDCPHCCSICDRNRCDYPAGHGEARDPKRNIFPRACMCEKCEDETIDQKRRKLNDMNTNVTELQCFYSCPICARNRCKFPAGHQVNRYSDTARLASECICDECEEEMKGPIKHEDQFVYCCDICQQNRCNLPAGHGKECFPDIAHLPNDCKCVECPMSGKRAAENPSNAAGNRSSSSMSSISMAGTTDLETAAPGRRYGIPHTMILNDGTTITLDGLPLPD